MTLEELPENIKSKIVLLDKHWIWIGATTNNYRTDLKGRIRFNDNLEYVHRVTFHLATGFDLSSNLQVNHKIECGISLCCNPECLYAGTQLENMRDRDLDGHNFQSNKTHCPLGHEFTVSPTTGHRYCQTCKNKRRDEWRKRIKK